ncbi:helix-turn-helix domain-containing protein [Paucisalibacillus globulus]|uniref:helix-turn-helix domain-containing protein n=1 Tax=Paucisalibacillus globulus TaxID=351095 RepID=UPI0003F508B6|nr:helix-turn-helix domain-containing protein [Paucisalibacillus globulus]
MAKKYSANLKMKVVKEYQEGHLGIRPLAKKHGIKSKSAVERWIKAYKKFGTEGLMDKKHPEIYPVQFKLDVLRFIDRTGSSETEAALHFGMTNLTAISSWKKDFYEGGIGVPKKPKGRPPMTGKGKAKSVKQEKAVSREEQLERENELLRLEIAYLKKLKAFQENPDAYLEKHKQQWHSNSKKKDSN